MTPLERAKLQIEQDIARRRREQQDRLKSRSTPTDHGRIQDAYQGQPFVIGMDLASGTDRTGYPQCANPSPTAIDTGSSSSSDSCSSSPSFSD